MRYAGQPGDRSSLLLSVYLQAAGVQQALLQHLHQDIHVRAVPAGLPAVEAGAAAVRQLTAATSHCVCE